jgi:hypothetical protein
MMFMLKEEKDRCKHPECKKRQYIAKLCEHHYLEAMRDVSGMRYGEGMRI